MSDEDVAVLEVIAGLEVQKLKIDALKAAPGCTLDKRALSIAITELETSMLWIPNHRGDM